MRRRKKIPITDRHHLDSQTAANQMWSKDFVFDCTAEGRSIKNLTVLDEAIHEAMAIVSEGALGENQLVRILEQLNTRRGLPKAIMTDNGKEIFSRAMLTWAHARGVKLFLIEQGKLKQNACIESFNGRFRDECLNEHWFTSLTYARVVVEAWRKEHNDERPKRSLDGHTTAAYAKTLIQKPVKLTSDSRPKCY